MSEKDWTDVPYPSGAVLIDGMAYTRGALRELVVQAREYRVDRAFWREAWERDQVKIEQLERRLKRADKLLRLRTAALVRLIAARKDRA